MVETELCLMAIRRTQRLVESLSTTASGMTGPRESRETLTGAEEMTALTDETDVQRGDPMMSGANWARIAWKELLRIPTVSPMIYS